MYRVESKQKVTGQEGRGSFLEELRHYSGYSDPKPWSELLMLRLVLVSRSLQACPGFDLPEVCHCE